MRFFGLISLVLVIAGAVWFLSKGIETVTPGGTTTTDTDSIGNIIDSAKGAADAIAR